MEKNLCNIIFCLPKRLGRAGQINKTILLLIGGLTKGHEYCIPFVLEWSFVLKKQTLPWDTKHKETMIYTAS